MYLPPSVLLFPSVPEFLRPHTHKYSNTFSFNEDYHWYKSTCIHTKEVSSKEKHNWDGGVLRDGEICSSEAVMVYTCTDCGAKRETIVVSHIYEVLQKKDASCTENGYLYKVCSVCGAEKTETVLALGHSFDEYDLVEPDCINAGEKSGYCKTCNEYVIIEIPALGHKGEKVVYNGEFCDGKALGDVVCSVCEEVVGSIDHKYEKSEISPSCEGEGTMAYSCVHCAKSYSETIPPRGHIGGEWRFYEGENCNDFGWGELYCIVCARIIDSITTTQKGHSYKTTESYTGIVHTCESCGDSYFEKTEKIIEIEFYFGSKKLRENLLISEGKSAFLPEVSLENYEFVGWYFDEELTNLYKEDYVFYEDTRLYASFKDAYTTGNYNSGEYLQNLPTNFTFDVKSELLLTNSNINNYITVSKSSGECVKIYILSSSNGVYTIASDEYESASVYRAAVRGGVEFTDTKSTERRFLTEGENYSKVILNRDVVTISKNEVYFVFEDSGSIYIVLRKDLLDEKLGKILENLTESFSSQSRKTFHRRAL